MGNLRLTENLEKMNQWKIDRSHYVFLSVERS